MCSHNVVCVVNYVLICCCVFVKKGVKNYKDTNVGYFINIIKNTVV